MGSLRLRQLDLAVLGGAALDRQVFRRNAFRTNNLHDETVVLFRLPKSPCVLFALYCRYGQPFPEGPDVIGQAGSHGGSSRQPSAVRILLDFRGISGNTIYNS
jgi:hypothetical protein